MESFVGKEYTEYQLRIIQSLSFFSGSRVTVESGDSRDNKYTIKDVGRVKSFCYFFAIANTIVKFIYLLLLVNGYFGPVDFLDKMCALLWILMCAEITQEILFWAFKYPLYEVLTCLWSLENILFAKIGKPQAIKDKCDRLYLHTILFHLFILIAGCIIIGVQFIWSPKYSVYTYAALEEDNLLLLSIFTCHEVLFMWQAWTLYLSIVTISSINAIELTGILEGMTYVMRTFKVAPQTDSFTVDYPKIELRHLSVKKVDGKVNEIIIMPPSLSAPNLKRSSAVKPFATSLSNTNRSRTGIYFHQYNSSEELVQDYKHLMFITSLLNDWSSYRVVGVHTIGYCQFVSDVFMMMQLIRLPEMDLPAVLWFGEDALMCILMMFRMFTLMSRVSTASNNFLWAAKDQMNFAFPLRRKTSRRLIRALQLVSLKLGPCHVRPGTVGKAIMMLMNYYIVVAMWKAV